MSDEPIEIIESLDQPEELTPHELEQSLQYALKINHIFDRGRRQTYIIALVHENMRLLKELNEARHALGLEPLPVWDNSKAIIA